MGCFKIGCYEYKLTASSVRNYKLSSVVVVVVVWVVVVVVVVVLDAFAFFGEMEG